MAALLSLSMVACSEDDMGGSEGANRFGEMEVGIMPTSTRADITDLQTGFLVYATSGEAPTDYMISGATYIFTSEWGWNGTSYSWPDATSGYPMTFYGIYQTGAYSVNANDVNTLNTDVTVKAAGSQVDILGAKATAATRPTGGKLSMEFNHIMTCVNLSIAATEESLLHIQSVKFVGSDDTNNYDYLTQAWGATTSIAADTPSYDYLALAKPAKIVINSGVTTSIVGAESGITPSYGSLYLMPQILTPWDTSTTLDDARVEIIFRSTDVVANATDDDKQLGYVEAQDHPDYTAASGVSATSPLFIRIAYPTTSSTKDNDDFTWGDGLSYNYAVTLGHNGVKNGYFASKYYYDEDGNETPFEIDNVEIGDEVSPGEICFNPTIVDWVDGGETTMN